MITKDTIDISKLVDEIHAAEAAHREGKWDEFCSDRGIRYTYYRSRFVTGLYTLRAWLRGKHHRQNHPEEIRDFNRTMIETDRSHLCQEWDEKEHNRKIAEGVAEGFRFEVPAETG